MSEKPQINWRTIGVKRERKYEELINRLNSGEKSIFQFIKDIMVFTAMIGYSNGTRVPISGETIEIILETYSSDEKDGFIYLLSLIETKDGTCLKDSNLHSSVNIFEEYCNDLSDKGFHKLLDFVWDKPYQFLFIDINQPTPKKYYKNFDLIIIPDEFLS